MKWICRWIVTDLGRVSEGEKFAPRIPIEINEALHEGSLN
jgi:hypothetical protein